MLPASHSPVAFGCSQPALGLDHANVLDASVFALRAAERETWARGFLMKKIYEKPVLSKRQKLSSVVASVSGPKS
ncbi:hypothetical protein [Mesorhizobium sp. B1-1-5]|uniref:hypothetical protein n=1 Tax=Mesorhizobium sp. B1-1-5 TaxID=2589979 RepID=UPI00112D5D9C|nr:hypothetical protein [Mesorhizobium sp. B1-1-5]TPO12005.1 hypothetical protein FJ980_03935 [Mesorhizobium sp. B1-1-5]